MRLIALVVLASLFGAACRVSPEIDIAEPAAAAQTAAEATIEPADDAPAVRPSETGEPETLAFAEDTAASPGFCTASANIWVHSTALNVLGDDANPEMTNIALLNIAEWLERASLFVEDEAAERATLFEAFGALQDRVSDEFSSDWLAFRNSSAYANDPNAQLWEDGRKSLIGFLTEECDNISAAQLSSDADARADELRAEYSTAPSTIVPSEALPNHMIFSHSSGRFIASFPAEWGHRELAGPPAINFVSSQDIDLMLAGGAIDGVYLQLVDAVTLEDFRELIDQTLVATTCERTNDLTDTGTSRLNITQTFDCPDHAAMIVGQYSEERELGMIAQGTFGQPKASRNDLIRFGGITNSVLWS